MIELRFLDGKLQYRDGEHNKNCCWIEVPQVKSEKKMDEKVWCEHMSIDGTILKTDCGRERHHLISYYHFCPICGIPRPKSTEKSLEEKFKYYIHDYSGTGPLEIAEGLAEIARQHFKELISAVYKKRYPEPGSATPDFTYFAKELLDSLDKSYSTEK